MDISLENHSKIDIKVNHWIRKLFDFSGRNRSIFFKPTKTSTIIISSPGINTLFKNIVETGNSMNFPLNEENLLPLFGENEILNSDRPKRILAENEIGSDNSQKELTKKLYNLYSRSRLAREEQGTNILFLAIGSLFWKETLKSEFVTSPIILIPVELVRPAPGKPYQLSMFEDDIVINPSLKEILRQEFDLTLEDLDDDLDFEKIDDYLDNLLYMIQEFPEWNVEKISLLDIFSYQKQIIVSDLKTNRAFLKENLLISSMCSNTPILNNASTLVEAKELDDKIDSHLSYQILDADSSQQEAIEAAKAGLSFILQGPPGTGKSQTIANIISEFLADGKQVLFVSAKMAALEVVQKRLSKSGLGDFCLQIHSHKRNKKEVIEELGHTLGLSSEKAPDEINEIIENCNDIRKKLNRYVRALHLPHNELGLSAFDCYGHLAKLKEIQNVAFTFSRTTSITRAEFRDLKNYINDFSIYKKILSNYDTHPWKGFNQSIESTDDKHQIEEIFTNLIQIFSDFHRVSTVLAYTYGKNSPTSINQITQLYEFAKEYHPNALIIPLKEIRNNYLNKYQSISRYLKREYWNDSALLTSIMRDASKPNNEQALLIVERIQNFKESSNFDQSSISVQNVDNLLQDIYELSKEFNLNISKIIKRYDSNSLPQILLDIKNVDLLKCIAWLDSQKSMIDQLIDWSNFMKYYQIGVKEGLKSYLDMLIKEHYDPKKWLDIFLKRFYSLWIEEELCHDADLLNFNSESFTRYIDEFRKLDRQQIKYTKLRIREKLLCNRSDSNWMTSTSTEEAVLRRELNKIRRIKPLRKLFKEIPGLILRLKPCLMMGPLTVSQLLDPDLFSFDLVIFDEASQIHPEEAVGAIYRGKQVIIVGDKNQLPPTAFFEIIDSDDSEDENDDYIGDLESILNEGDAAGLNSKMLKWHYRSKDESLIAFSNHHIYNDRLLTFPSPFFDKSISGVSFEFIPNSIYQRKSHNNPIEASKVVDLIIQHYEENPSLSLGVVTFGQAHKDRIELELNQRLREYPSITKYFYDNIDEEPCFIKSLEFVQGDERDVIIFSVGYGKDEVGKFIQNFGPLNRDGGERRLNVAVTRARQKVILVSSIHPEDIDLSKTNSKGVKLLRSYMEMARDGLIAIYKDLDVNDDAEVESPFESAVLDALQLKGLIVKKQVGVSGYRIDLAIVDEDQPGRFICGIECDGAMYHSGLTARDRDRLRQEVLEGLGWRIHRIWSRDWFNNENNEIQKILDIVKDYKKKM